MGSNLLSVRWASGNKENIMTGEIIAAWCRLNSICHAIQSTRADQLSEAMSKMDEARKELEDLINAQIKAK